MLTSFTRIGCNPANTILFFICPCPKRARVPRNHGLVIISRLCNKNIPSLCDGIFLLQFIFAVAFPSVIFISLPPEKKLLWFYFSELFKKTFKMSPVRFVTKLRIDYAKELLVTNRYSVSEIVETCGFSNAYYFSNVFKKQTGFSPSQHPIDYI